MTKTTIPSSSIFRQAHISDCGQYRWSLSRTWDSDKPRCLWIMLNPSTADHLVDDPTIRKCMGFARQWGCGSIEVCNLFSYRATAPKDMMAARDPVGLLNDTILREATALCRINVAAWGSLGRFQNRDVAVYRLLCDVPLECLGRTKDGHPRHPLYVPYDQVREPFILFPTLRLDATVPEACTPENLEKAKRDLDAGLGRDLGDYLAARCDHF